MRRLAQATALALALGGVTAQAQDNTAAQQPATQQTERERKEAERQRKKEEKEAAKRQQQKVGVRCARLNRKS